MFYDRSLNGIWEQNEFGTYPFNADPPLVQTAATISPAENVNLFDNSSAGAAPGPSLAPINPVMTGTPTASGVVFKAPSYQDYNLSVQREVMPSTVLELGYVGTKGTHLLGDIDLNQPTVAARTANEVVDVNAIRPFAGYGAFGDRSTVFTSNYNSLQASLNRRMSHGLTLGVSYTWSRLLTTNPVDRAWGRYEYLQLEARLRAIDTKHAADIRRSAICTRSHSSGTSMAWAGSWVVGNFPVSSTFRPGNPSPVTQSLDPFDPVQPISPLQARKPGNRFSARRRYEPGQSERQRQRSENRQRVLQYRCVFTISGNVRQLASRSGIGTRLPTLGHLAV